MNTNTNNTIEAPAREKDELRETIVEIARQLENVKAGKGYKNLSLLRRHGLIEEREEWLHCDTYSRKTGRTITRLSEKGNRMLRAANIYMMR